MSARINLIGRRFGNLTVIGEGEPDKRGQPRWLCQCDCGNTNNVSTTLLKRGHSKSCGCLRHKTPPTFIDRTGKRYGRLIAIRLLGYKLHNAIWECICDCGKTVNVYGSKLGRETWSCGCWRRDLNSTHGLSKKTIYRRWIGMRVRCYNKTYHQYHDYGGRGIGVCEEWRNNFQAFYDWAIANGYEDNLTLDRIDNDKGYSPDNCRWATMQVQNSNKRRKGGGGGKPFEQITIDNETHTFKEWGEISGIPYILPTVIN